MNCFMEQLLETFLLPINIKMHEHLHIENLDSSIYIGQSVLLTYDVACVGNGRFFYFNEDGKIDLHALV